MQYPTAKIRNVCLMGHGGAGKTSLAEAMLYYSKGTDRLGKTADGTTVCDFDPEEIKRQISVSTSIAPVEWAGHKINLIDTPGYYDFEGEVLQGLCAAEAAAIVVSAKDGVHYGTKKAHKLCTARNLPTFFIISKLDEENSDYQGTFEKIKSEFGPGVCALSLPIIKDGKIEGFVDLLDGKGKNYTTGQMVEVPIPDDMKDLIPAMQSTLMEAVAEADDDLMEKFFADEPFTAEEIIYGFSKGVLSHTVKPVLACSAVSLAGIKFVLDTMVHYLPAPSADENAAAAAMVFKTIADPFVGKMSFFKILGGKVTSGTSLTNRKTGAVEKMGHIFVVKGKKQTEVDALSAGDIGVVTKLQNTNTGDVLCAAGADVEVEEIKYPRPCLSMAIVPKSKGDEEKISQGLQRLAEEDPTFTYVNDAETHEQVISGMGETHLDVLVSKLKSKFGVGVDLKEPRVPYREAIRKKVRQQGKHKKQSGGHGQYGDVIIEFEPYDGEELLFEEKIFGGSVPKNFHPAVEKGLRESAARGFLAGYPVVGLKATLVDGSYHDVDSSEMSFKMAASIAFKEGLKNASPTILEPIGELHVIVPDRMMGDIIGDINKRRGQIMGMNPYEEDPGFQEVVAEVPMSEMHSYAIDLRSMTRGRGSFVLDFVRYQDAPPNITQKVISEAKISDDE